MTDAKVVVGRKHLFVENEGRYTIGCQPKKWRVLEEMYKHATVFRADEVTCKFCLKKIAASENNAGEQMASVTEETHSVVE